MVGTTAQTEATRFHIPETRSLHEEVDDGRRGRRTLDKASSKRAVHLAHRSIPATTDSRGRVGNVVRKVALVEGSSTTAGSSGFVGQRGGVVRRGRLGIDSDAGAGRLRLSVLRVVLVVVLAGLAFGVLHGDHSKGDQRVNDALFRLHDDDVAGGVCV